jgi:3-phosphoshikimate 1-carboxyvinyltransferase
MAMAFAIAALAADGPSTIDGADAVDISYPGFFETLGALVDSNGHAVSAGRDHGSRTD